MLKKLRTYTLLILLISAGMQSTEVTACQSKRLVQSSLFGALTGTCLYGLGYLLGTIKEKKTSYALGAAGACAFAGVLYSYFFGGPRVDCTIFCFEENVPAFKLSCGHLVCKKCFMEMINYAVTSKSGQGLLCIEPNCIDAHSARRTEISMLDIRSAAGQEIANRICDIKTNEALRNDPNMLPCPTPNCEWAYDRAGARQSITCPSCQKTYCCKCRKLHADAITCEQHLKKEKERADEAEVRKWHAQNTKQCPYCTKLIHRINDTAIDGCYIMTCDGCKGYFCWMCLEKTPENRYAHLGQCKKLVTVK